MLSSLHIKNIALIDDLTIRLGEGLNILSGETGAGKSIIIDSLNFALGERADKSLIGSGADSASVEAVFESITSQTVKKYLVDIGVEPEDTLIIYRVMSESGRNECRLNGRAVTLSMLKGLTELLADIHGQHEHQSLFRVSSHIVLLDGYGGAEIEDLKNETASAHTDYRAVADKLKRFGNASERAQKLDVLGYQIEELKQASLTDGEEDELLARRKRFRNSEKLSEASQSAAQLLNGDGEGQSAAAALSRAINALYSISEYDESLSGLLERLEAVKIEVRDIEETVSEFSDRVRYNAAEAEAVEERLEKVRQLSRKYGGSVQSALEFLSNAEQEFAMLSNAAESVELLEKQKKQFGQKLIDKADKLSKARQKYAEKLAADINEQLADLGMGGSQFKVEFCNVKKDAESCGADGFDSIEFLISPNIGESLKPLAKIISGGELSRFMLALKNITARLDNITTMVFDEIDTGISGHIAQVVAEKLYNISTDRQVIAVTHLPQLASMADLHYFISKSVENGKTRTHITVLDNDGELNEIARLIGGNQYSSHALPHAAEMKKHSNDYKNSLNKQKIN